MTYFLFNKTGGDTTGMDISNVQVNTYRSKIQRREGKKRGLRQRDEDTTYICVGGRDEHIIL